MFGRIYPFRSVSDITGIKLFLFYAVTQRYCWTGVRSLIDFIACSRNDHFDNRIDFVKEKVQSGKENRYSRYCSSECLCSHNRLNDHRQYCYSHSAQQQNCQNTGKKRSVYDEERWSSCKHRI